LLENVRLGWGKGTFVGLLAIGFGVRASAQSQNRQLESLIREGRRFGCRRVRPSRSTLTGNRMAPEKSRSQSRTSSSVTCSKALRDARTAVRPRSSVGEGCQLHIGWGWFILRGQNAKALEQLRSAERLDARDSTFPRCGAGTTSRGQYPGLR